MVVCGVLTLDDAYRAIDFNVVVGSGLLSALFVNDTICLMLTPVLLAALAPLDVRPTPCGARRSCADLRVSPVGIPVTLLTLAWGLVALLA
jgi:hypothetical protein